MKALRPGTALVFMTSVTMLAMTTVATDVAVQSAFQPLPSAVAAPADNPSTAARVALGRLLFWDPVLSGQKDVACGTCHHPSFGYSDGLAVSIGANGAGLGSARTFRPGHPERLVKRNSQTILNAAYNGLTDGDAWSPADAPMFWDLRVRSLEAQALEPLKALEEMRGDTYPEHQALDAVVARLNAIPEYVRLFGRAFGGSHAVTAPNLGRAIAAFERTLVTSNAPFDRYLRGDVTAMTDAQIRGMQRFQTTGCINCHRGPMLSDFAPHVLGVPDQPRLAASDTGVNQTYAFRTASLRNLGATAPYMHSGVFTTLGDVVNFYQRISRGGGRRGGGRAGALNAQVPRDQIDPLARRLNMRGRGQGDLVAFLQALDDPDFDRTIPERVPSGLPVGGTLAP